MREGKSEREKGQNEPDDFFFASTVFLCHFFPRPSFLVCEDKCSNEEEGLNNAYTFLRISNAFQDKDTAVKRHFSAKMEEEITWDPFYEKSHQATHPTTLSSSLRFPPTNLDPTFPPFLGMFSTLPLMINR